MINYLLETTLFWTGAYLLYFILLRRQTYHALNRWYLLISLVAGALLPLLHLKPAANETSVFYFDPIVISSSGMATAPQTEASLTALPLFNTRKMV